MKKQLKTPKKMPINRVTKQNAMIQAMKVQLGNVTASAAEVGIDRSTHIKWMEKYPEYREKIEGIAEEVLDFAENSLYRQIMAHNTQATIFFLKTKGKHRGYVEKKELEVNGTVVTATTDREIEETIKRLLK